MRVREIASNRAEISPARLNTEPSSSFWRRFDMNRRRYLSELLRQLSFDLYSDRVRDDVVALQLARDMQMHFDEHIAALRARPDVVHGMDAPHAPDNFGDAPGGHRSGVNQYGHRGPENLVAAPGDDNRDPERNYRIEPDITETDQDQADEH